MADNINVKVEGSDYLMRNLRKLIGKKRSDAIKLMNSTAVDIMADAKREAPSSEGQIRNSISILEKRSDGLGITVGTNVHHAPFIEFGTRQKKTKEYKVSNYNKGTWEEFVASIERWAKRKGISNDEGFSAELIARAIYLNGIDPQPFLTPAFEKHRKLFMKELRRLMKEDTR